MVPTELPPARTREPKYVKYVPIVEEFAKSGEQCVEIVPDDGDEPASSYPWRFTSAIHHLGLNHEVGISTRKGRVFLVRR